MLAEKLLKNQVTDPVKIEKIISFLCSESGSHDYTINRREAKDNLGLNIEKPDESLYILVKDTYNSLKEELKLNIPFDPNIQLGESAEGNYSEPRAILESIPGGTDAFVSEGILKRVQIQMQNGLIQQAVNDQRNFEGWRHYVQN